MRSGGGGFGRTAMEELAYKPLELFQLPGLDPRVVQLRYEFMEAEKIGGPPSGCTCGGCFSVFLEDKVCFLANLL